MRMNQQQWNALIAAPGAAAAMRTATNNGKRLCYCNNVGAESFMRSDGCCLLGILWPLGLKMHFMPINEVFCLNYGNVEI